MEKINSVTQYLCSFYMLLRDGVLTSNLRLHDRRLLHREECSSQPRLKAPNLSLPIRYRCGAFRRGNDGMDLLFFIHSFNCSIKHTAPGHQHLAASRATMVKEPFGQESFKC